MAVGSFELGLWQFVGLHLRSFSMPGIQDASLKSGELPAIHTPPGAGLVVEVIIVVDSGTESGMVQEEEEDVEEDAAAAAAALAAVVRRHGC